MAHTDWHPADIKAALEKAGTSLSQLARDHGLVRQSIEIALRRPQYRAEVIIADALGLHPSAIWPSRYREDGLPHVPVWPQGWRLGGQRNSRRPRVHTKDRAAG